jgi:hypothetical protein
MCNGQEIAGEMFIVFFVPSACIVLEITSEREWANISGEEWRF